MKRLDTEYLAIGGSWVWIMGRMSISVLMLAGLWVSIGVHVSIVPTYVEFHVLWFVIAIQDRARGEEQKEAEKAWLEENSR